MEKRFSRRQFLRRASALGARLAVVAPILAACGPTPTPKVIKETVVVEKEKVVEKAVTKLVEKEVIKEVTRAPAAKGSVKLVVDTRLGTSQNYMHDTKPLFEKANPHVTIEIRQHPDYFTKVVALAASKTEGDVIWGYIGGGVYLTFAVKGILRALDDLVKAEGFDLGQYFPGSVDSGRWEGKLYALPEGGFPANRPTFYNDNFFKAAGVKYDHKVDLDWTTDNLVDIALKITRRTGDKVDVFGHLPSRDFQGFVGWLRVFGADLLAPDGRKCVMNTPQGVECIQYLHDLFYKHKVSPTPQQIEQNDQNMFVAQKLAMFESASGTIDTLLATLGGKFTFGVANRPKHAKTGKRGEMWGANHLGLSARTKYVEDAWELIKYWTSHEIGVYKSVSGSGTPGGRPDVWYDPRLAAMHPGFAICADAQKFSGPHILPWNLRGTELTTVLANEMDQVWLNKVDVAEGVKKAAQAVQEVLDKPAQ